MTVHFLLPGYAPRSVGGYRVVYDYALEIQRAFNEEVVIYHSPWPILRSVTRLKPRAFAGLMLRSAAVLKDRPSVRGVRWYPETSELDLRFSLGTPRIRLSDEDVLIATSAHTAPVVLSYSGNATRTYFIQHVETWSASKEFIDSTWLLPLRRIVIAPWLQEYGLDLGVTTTIVPNAIDSRDFPPGPPLRDRRRQVLTMLSPLAFKRSDLAIDVLERVRSQDPLVRAVAFGVNSRPKGLPSFVEYHARPSRKELSALYRESQVYLCTSDAEGWHLPPGEALMSGTAVVSTDIGGVRVVAEEDALYGPPGDSDLLSRQVLALLEDVEEAQRMATRGQLRLSTYTPSEAAKAFYRELRRSGTP